MGIHDFSGEPNQYCSGETSTLTANFNDAFDGTTVTPLNPADGLDIFNYLFKFSVLGD